MFFLSLISLFLFSFSTFATPDFEIAKEFIAKKFQIKLDQYKERYTGKVAMADNCELIYEISQKEGTPHSIRIRLLQNGRGIGSFGFTNKAYFTPRWRLNSAKEVIGFEYHHEEVYDCETQGCSQSGVVHHYINDKEVSSESYDFIQAGYYKLTRSSCRWQ